ncbi:MAG TPA: hypothetical protein VF066_04850 [Thermoleophilaceae bacterium]
MGESPPDGDRSSNRSTPRFDPMASMRAVADIQAEGLHAAAELIDRMVRREPDASAERPPSAAGPYTALVDAWIDLMRRTVDNLARPGQPGALTVAVDAEGVAPELHLALPGDDEVAEVWLHNGSSSAVGPLVLHCSPLSDSDGAPLEGARVRFEPAEVPLLPARSSRGIAVSLAARGPLPPGTYRGAIQARGAPKLWLPFEVTIEPC